MDDPAYYLIIGMYVLLVFCLIFFFVIGKRIHQMGSKISKFEISNKKEMDRVKKQVDLLKENIDKTQESLK